MKVSSTDLQKLEQRLNELISGYNSFHIFIDIDTRETALQIDFGDKHFRQSLSKFFVNDIQSQFDIIALNAAQYFAL